MTLGHEPYRNFQRLNVSVTQKRTVRQCDNGTMRKNPIVPLSHRLIVSFELLFRFQLLRRGFAVFENAVEHFGAFGAARGELRVGLLLLIF